MTKIYIFSMLKWNSNLLHRSHMLSKYFSRNDVKACYVEKSNTLNIFKWGKSSYKKDEVNQLIIYGIPYFRGWSKLIFRFNDFLIKTALERHFDGENISSAIALISTPHWSRSIDNVKAFTNNIFYDISDDYIAFAENNKWKRILSEYERKAVEISKVCFVTSDNLQNKVNNKGIVVENGVDLIQFSTAKKIELPGKGKKIGFIGGLFDWIDFELIVKIAKDNPEDTIFLIGPTNAKAILEMMKSIHNIEYLGAIDKDEIHHYYASFDIGIIPFLSEDKYPRLKSVNSNKVFQYLYFGYPIVTTAFSQVNQMKEMLIVSDTHEMFLENIKKAKNGSIDFIKFEPDEVSWDSKAKKMLQYF